MIDTTGKFLRLGAGGLKPRHPRGDKEQTMKSQKLEMMAAVGLVMAVIVCLVLAGGSSPASGKQLAPMPALAVK